MEAQCCVCRRAFSLEEEVNEGFEAMCICRECKIMVLDHNQTGLTIRDYRRLSQTRSGNSEQREESFPRRFSQLINLASHTNEGQLEGGTPVSIRQHRRNIVSHSRSQRRQRALSDNESYGPDRVESLFGDTDSNISFSGYGGDSDASVDGYSSLDTGTFLPLDYEQYSYIDSDIDPMHAGTDQWDSDYGDDDHIDWEEAVLDATIAYAETDRQFQDATSGLDNTGGRDAQDSTWVNWRAGEVQEALYSDIFADFEGERLNYVRNSGDYVDAMGFEELLEQLAEADSSRRGAPPAAASYVRNLPCISVSKDHEKDGPLICAVCKDSILANMEAKQLPCRHLYHPSCISPWLNTRNSCPICRYELPTDDLEYEETKRYRSRTEGNQNPHLYLDEENNNTSSESEVDNAAHARVEHGSSEDVDHVAERSNREDSRGRWLLIAVAPIVSIVGMALVIWLGKPESDRRIQGNLQDRHFNRYQSTPSRDDRNRR